MPGVFGFEFLPPKLATAIGAHRPYFDGLQYPGLDGRCQPLTSTEAIAEAMESQIQRSIRRVLFG